MYRSLLAALILLSTATAPVGGQPLPKHPVADPKPRVDSEGLPLPAEAIRRFGSARFCTDPPRSVAFSPDGKVAYLVPVRVPAWVLADTPPVVSAWEMPSGRPLWQFTDNTLTGMQVTADPDGKVAWLAGRVGENERKPGETPAVRVKLAADTGKELDRKVLGKGWSDALDLRADGTLAWNLLEMKGEVLDLTLRLLKPDGTDALGWDPVGQGIGLIKFSPDGKTLFVGGLADEGRGWKLTAVDVGTGRAKWTVDTTMQDTLAVSPDGKTVAIAVSGDPPPSEQRVPNPEDERPESTKVVGYHTDTGKAIGEVSFGKEYFLSFRTNEPGTGRPLSFTRRGQAVLVQNNEQKTVVIDAETWKADRELRTDWEAYGWRTPDGKSFLGYPRWWYRNLTLYSTGTREPLDPPPLLQRGERGRGGVGVEFSPDGGRLYYGLAEYRERVEWDVVTGKELGRVAWDKRKGEPYTNPLGNIARQSGTFRSSDGKLEYDFLRREDDGTPTGKVVDVKTGRRLVELSLKRLRPLAFSADAKWLIGIDRGKVGVWDVKTGGEPTTVEGPPHFEHSRREGDALLRDPTTNRVVLTEKYDYSRDNREGKWRLWRYDLDPLKLSAKWEGPGRLKDVFFTPDGRLVGRFRAERAKPYWAESVFVVTPDATGPVTFPTDAGGGGFAVSPHGGMVALSTPTGDIHLYELASGKRRHTFVGLTRPATTLAFSPDGRYLASESADAPVLLWDVRGDLTKPAKPDAAGWEAAWKALGGGDAEAGFKAVRLFALHPDDGVPELKKRFVGSKPPPGEEIAALVAKLGDRDFQTREQAERALKALGLAAAPALRNAIKTDSSEEVQLRANRVLAATTLAETLLAERAVEALTLANTEAARKQLGEWAKGPGDHPLTTAAKRER